MLEITPLPEIEIPLIINELNVKTHETTGNKPEMQNKHNMNSSIQLSPIRDVENLNHLHILIPTKTTSNSTTTGKWNTIDNQPLTPQNIGNNRKQTGNTGNKLEMNKKHNVNWDYHKMHADRYKNAQPLMVPFYAEQESRKQNN